MSLMYVVEELRKGKVLYAARAEFNNYHGSLVFGHTYHYLLTHDSKPNIALEYEENKALGKVRDLDTNELIYYRHIVIEKSIVPYREKGYTVYIARVPFKVFIQHFGETGDRVDSNIRVEESKPLRSVEELEELLVGEQE